MKCCFTKIVPCYYKYSTPGLNPEIIHFLYQDLDVRTFRFCITVIAYILPMIHLTIAKKKSVDTLIFAQFLALG